MIIVWWYLSVGIIVAWLLLTGMIISWLFFGIIIIAWVLFKSMINYPVIIFRRHDYRISKFVQWGWLSCTTLFTQLIVWEFLNMAKQECFFAWSLNCVLSAPYYWLGEILPHNLRFISHTCKYVIFLCGMLIAWLFLARFKQVFGFV